MKSELTDWQYRGSGASCNDCNSPVNGNGPHRASDGASTTSSQDITPDSSRTTFMVSILGFLVAVFMIGFYPNQCYIIYSIAAVILLRKRFYYYKRYKNHYFLVDFCYYETLLVFIYLWLPFSDSIRGALFPIVFAFSHGPLLGAVLFWRNSIVPHSADKMTNIFVHVTPAITLWGLRWFSTIEQGFPLCENPTMAGPGGCDHVGSSELMYGPMIMYLIWKTIYIAVIFFWRKDRLRERSYNYSFLHLVDNKGLLYPLCCMFGPQYRKLLYVVWHIIYALGSLLVAFPCFHNSTASVWLVGVMLLIASYNGATYYRNVHNRQNNTPE